jgi:chorismate mutase
MRILKAWERVHLNSARIVMIAAMAMTSVCDGRAQTAVDQLEPLVETSARRLNLAQEVAFAKWDNGTAVEDPPREEHVIASAVTEGKTEGLEPAVVSRFFRAQIEANKVVQSSLLTTWHKVGKAPDHQTKDLTTTIRPQLDEIQKQLIEELVSTAPARAGTTCRLDLAAAVSQYLTTHRISAADLQATALNQSLAAFCP